MSRLFHWTLTCLFLIGNYSAYNQQIVHTDNSDEKGNDLGYMYAFSEATKMFIFGDYGRAANLYRECLKYEPESSAVHYQLAQLYLKAGDLKNAFGYSFKAHKLDNQNKWYSIQLATIYQARQLYDSAVYLFEGLLTGSPEDIRIYYQISALYERKGDLKESMKYLNIIEEKFGKSTETAAGKSRIYDRMNEKGAALLQLRGALTGTEEDYIIYGMIAEHYRKYKRADSAEFYYRKIIKDHGEDSNVMFSYGEFLLEQKRIREAKTLYADMFRNKNLDENTKYGYLFNAVQDPGFFTRLKPVIDTIACIMILNSPEDMRVMSLYSDVNYRLGNYRASCGVLKKIIDRDKNNYAALEQLIFCESAMGQGDSVIYFGEIAISRFEERPLAYLLVSSVQYTGKEYNKAIALLEKGKDYADTDALKLEFYSLLAECYGRIEDTVKSDGYYEEALGIDSSNIAILNNYAYSLAVRHSDLDRAESMSKLTVTAEPENATYLDTYAWVMYKKKKYKEAGQWIRKALRYGGERDADILDHYGDILYKNGKAKKAVATWNEATKYANMELKKKINLKIIASLNGNFSDL